jgi:hypothetical protein
MAEGRDLAICWRIVMTGAVRPFILVADEEFRVGERGSEDEKCIAFFTASQ